MVFQSRYCSADLWIVSIQFSWVGNNLQTLVYLLCFVLETYLKVVHFWHVAKLDWFFVVVEIRFNMFFRYQRREWFCYLERSALIIDRYEIVCSCLGFLNARWRYVSFVGWWWFVFVRCCSNTCFLCWHCLWIVGYLGCAWRENDFKVFERLNVILMISFRILLLGEWGRRPDDRNWILVDFSMFPGEFEGSLLRFLFFCWERRRSSYRWT